MKECAETGWISEASHVALLGAVAAMKSAEYWSLRNQSRHEGRNATTDEQIAVSRVALPALELAHIALAEEDYDMAIDQLTLAITTDGRKSKQDLRRKSN